MEESDIFATTVGLDEAQLKAGFDEGFAEGVIAGEIEGREVGLKIGFQVGEELGFYGGCAQLWISLLQRDESAFSARAARGIQQLRDLVRDYPVLDHQNEQLQEKLDAIRGKFRAVSSMVGVKLDYQGMPSAGSDGRSF
ncbi:hypothetical protein SELMODRAFT_84379 [Selaginella moellendorffii]|uniref:Essential protein Yae1 N-terminal domain-containing protein n=1 Tax=Selaginella moellendorffii TaxID=88036 RepID=D8R3R2_SELML|nr:oral cancer-overexpressed protein 1 homolog [Selaginella moellendorffii]EFJ33328.1 hypothetical protein SELMODRAFT_84379 [Selaginella moellendorffii]|eukprot:XP_002965908.1 oral cancer-overexpressed protein 1 homolog [Selaginella moellendorffii]